MSGVFKLAFGIVIVAVLVWWFISDHESGSPGAFDFQTTGYEDVTEDRVEDGKTDRADVQKPLPDEYSGSRLPENSNITRGDTSEDEAISNDGVRGAEQRREEFEDLSPSEFVGQREEELRETISNYHRILSNRRR